MIDAIKARDSVDLTNCDREPIHIPGAILPHGAMLVLECPTLRVLQAAGDTAGLLGQPLAELLDRPIDTLLSREQVNLLRARAAARPFPRHPCGPPTPRGVAAPRLRLPKTLPATHIVGSCTFSTLSTSVQPRAWRAIARGRSLVPSLDAGGCGGGRATVTSQPSRGASPLLSTSDAAIAATAPAPLIHAQPRTTLVEASRRCSMRAQAIATSGMLDVLRAATHVRGDAVRRMEFVAKLLDGAFTFPGTKQQFGIDAIIGLVPGFGDVATTLLSSYVIWEARNLGVSRVALGRMVANLAIHATIGAIPIVGDLFDAFFRVNQRNMKIVRAQLSRSR